MLSNICYSALWLCTCPDSGTHQCNVLRPVALFHLCNTQFALHYLKLHFKALNCIAAMYGRIQNGWRLHLLAGTAIIASISIAHKYHHYNWYFCRHFLPSIYLDTFDNTAKWISKWCQFMEEIVCQKFDRDMFRKPCFFLPHHTIRDKWFFETPKQ